MLEPHKHRSEGLSFWNSKANDHPADTDMPRLGEVKLKATVRYLGRGDLSQW
jgi:hypothetical protein